VYFSGYVVDRLLGIGLPRGGNDSRNQLTEGDALQVSRLGACWVPIVILSLSNVILSLSNVILSLSNVILSLSNVILSLSKDDSASTPPQFHPSTSSG
jgi:hypothetical protein